MGKSVLVKALKAAVREQKLDVLYAKLEQLVPDINDQYTNDDISSEYFHVKVRAEHAFQISMVQRALDIYGFVPGANGDNQITLVDVGDSSGNHITYLKKLYGEINSLSVNLDKTAVEKIKHKGLKAIHARAEDLHKHNVHADIFVSFEMLEHLHDPVRFLKSISETGCKLFVITVPYMRRSRVGLHHIRNKLHTPQSGESTHIFELSPEDWKLLFQHAGWEAVYERIYLQYPRFGMLHIASHYFRNSDFEGFYGVVLRPNPAWKEKYTDW